MQHVLLWNYFLEKWDNDNNRDSTPEVHCMVTGVMTDDPHLDSTPRCQLLNAVYVADNQDAFTTRDNIIDTTR
jgi:hypothetical protein